MRISFRLCQVPNAEGRAGMCGIVDTNGSLDLEQLARETARDLPAYARPIFLRVMTAVDMTGEILHHYVRY